MKNGFIRAAAATPEIKVADCPHNVEQIIKLIKQAAAEECSLVVFPELCVTGYTCGDLFLQKALLDAARKAVMKIARKTATLDLLSVVGFPLAFQGALYNCAAVLYHGKVLGMVPKQNIPNYSEFYEARHFTSGAALSGQNLRVELGEDWVPFGAGLLFCCESVPELVLGVEICEDLWVPTPPSTQLALMGATVICNLSASDEVIGKAAYRRNLVTTQSARLLCGYLYADAGAGESTTDLVFSGHSLLCENGAVLAESPLFHAGLTMTELDLQKLEEERRRTTTFVPLPWEQARRISFSLPQKELGLALFRDISPSPFVPAGKEDLEQRCQAILTMQSSGLAGRLKHIGCRTAVIGLSGGLDSTLALIVAVHAFDLLGLDRSGILAVTMPGFGTTSRTRSNAEELAAAYGVSFQEIPIGEAVQVHFRDIGQNPDTQDITYENAQARERTQVLMDLANQRGGLVIGTGDLSELALGWATYNGDHMSMYAVNASIPKTLVRHLTAWEAGRSEGKLREILLDILDTPVSPELLPPKDGEISQKTEELVGPYELHDFFLYYFLRFGFPPSKILRLAEIAFQGQYRREEIIKWLTVFIRRFFSQQFKRSCLPDGPKVGTVTLSPRGDWRMPSDACSAVWLQELESLAARSSSSLD